MSNVLTCPCSFESIFVEWVYLLYSDCGTFFKIGITSNPRIRFTELRRHLSYSSQHSSIFPCFYVGEASYIEDFIKREFSDFRSNGLLKFDGHTECFDMACWYDVEDLLIDYFLGRKFCRVGDLKKLPRKMWV